MSRWALFLTLAATATAAAGCATPAGEGNVLPSSTPTTEPTTPTTEEGKSEPEFSPAEARALIEDALNDLPPQFGVGMHAVNGSREIMKLEGLFDHSAGITYLDMSMDAEAFGEAMPDPAAATLLRDGFTIYETPQATVWMVNGTAFTFAPDSSVLQSIFGDEDPMKAIREMGDPHKFFGNFTNESEKDNETVITAMTPTIFRGHSAISMSATTTKEGTPYSLTMIIYTDPLLPAHMEGTLPPGDDLDDPLREARVEMDFYYGNEVMARIPDDIKRVQGLAYASDEPNAFGRTESTWTFLVSGGVPTTDAIVELKNAAAAAQADSPVPMGVAELPTMWSMALAEGSRTREGVTVTFTDHDADGLVSAGDTLRVAWPLGTQPPAAVLKDVQTGNYIVPGAGAWAALGAIALVAVALRRR